MNRLRVLLILLFIGSLVANIGCVKAEQPAKAVTEKSNELTLQWSEDFNAVQEAAKEKNLPILINFTGSDWCGWCIKLGTEVFNTKEFIAYADTSFVLFKADFPKSIPQSQELKQQNEGLMRKYGVRGFPTIIILAPDGTLIAQTGYQAGGPIKYIESLEGILKEKK
ncbi:MAG: thioredoxin family protein [Candidatus Cloacimonetes bacterium]|nr:thioredoxin family protein [Candidatus Cloacimonadota bacterium]